MAAQYLVTLGFGIAQRENPAHAGELIAAELYYQGQPDFDARLHEFTSTSMQWESSAAAPGRWLCDGVPVCGGRCSAASGSGSLTPAWVAPPGTFAHRAFPGAAAAPRCRRATGPGSARRERTSRSTIRGLAPWPSSTHAPQLLAGHEQAAFVRRGAQAEAADGHVVHTHGESLAVKHELGAIRLPERFLRARKAAPLQVDDVVRQRGHQLQRGAG